MSDPEKAELLAELAAARAKIATTGTALQAASDSIRCFAVSNGGHSRCPTSFFARSHN